MTLLALFIVSLIRGSNSVRPVLQAEENRLLGQMGAVRRGMLPCLSFIFAAFIAFVPSSFAGDISAGKEKAVKCKQCHGFDGIGKQPNFPNIAGQKEAYLIRQLEAYRTGGRQNDMMTFISGNLSDDDIKNLAAYYSAIRIDVRLPE